MLLWSISCLDWSILEDIQARTAKGRLSWTGRRYLAGTVKGRPSWFGSLLPEVQGTSSWCISWMLEQHEDQAQSVKSSSSAEARAEKKCRVEAQNAQVLNRSSADQVQCTRAVIECEAVYKSICLRMIWRRFLNGSRGQARKTGARDVKNRAQLEAAAMLTWIPDVGVLALIQLLRVISCWYVSCVDQQRELRNFEATKFCVQEPAVGFASVFISVHQNYVA
ncbi:cytidine deaminase 1-like [Dorcoceras hygrometricum]|uniref:Cytidine deaminase 1-like n=1 Tax=Dorcoceras hygrometricum TaxID=472368 RepID=A0A2Z7CZK8_9LAMI|nr:cytidine deaminase 1-like [Dorcoceras hygrometricum]